MKRILPNVFRLRLVALLLCALSSCRADTSRESSFDSYIPGITHSGQPATIRMLAHDLDELESHIERTGSIVAQHPTIWGQARLTQHREDYEKQMAGELGNFQLTLSGALNRSDQAYLANSFALGAAISGPSAASTPTRVSVNSVSNTQTQPTIPIPTPDVATDTFDAFKSISRTGVATPYMPGYSNLGKGGVTLEPTVYLSQKSRYLNHLNELRRINEGDDTADSPGYSLNLIRMPVSILPGHSTQEGHGAEITMSLKPYLTPELLPTTFRNLVVNDLLDVLGVPMTEQLNSDTFKAYFQESSLNDELKLALQETTNTDVTKFELLRSRLYCTTGIDDLFREWEKMGEEQKRESKNTKAYLDPLYKTGNLIEITEAKKDEIYKALTGDIKTMKDSQKSIDDDIASFEWSDLKEPRVNRDKLGNVFKSLKGQNEDIVVTIMNRVKSLPSYSEFIKLADRLPRSKSLSEDQKTQNKKDDALDKLIAVEQDIKRRLEFQLDVSSTTKLRHSKRPFPTSQVEEIFGANKLLDLFVESYDALRRNPANGYWIHYPDVESYLQEEIAAAQRLLAEKSNRHLWEFCCPRLVELIHNRKIDASENQKTNLKICPDDLRLNPQEMDSVSEMRKAFGKRIGKHSSDTSDNEATITLAWAIIVESALLNDQLIQDMKEASVSKGCPCPEPGCWPDFYMPEPSPQARQSFIDYVRCRWPVIIFALDPVEDQQNIADQYSERREMQMAISLAFVSGNMSAKNMMRYARRLETDIEAVAINSTSVGFAHGNETFGWRFYPRFQTPDTSSNTTVFFRDLIVGDESRNSKLRQRKLEPGMRECTAIVLMPSFVPYATLETSSNWFRLTDPKCKLMTTADAMNLSAQVKKIDSTVQTVCDVEKYRPDDLERLRERGKQLEARLPLQSARVQVPYENTLGGFAMFNTGLTDLAPELLGWYGAPGVNTDDDTTLFLIGNHFSVHDTKIIVGGKQITDSELLSRQVMRVTIPKGTLPLDRSSGRYPVPVVKNDTPTPANVDFLPNYQLQIEGTAGGATVNLGATFTIDGGVAVPKGPQSPKSSDQPTTSPELFVDVHVATPYGVTSHLLIPAFSAKAAAAGGAAASSGSSASAGGGTSVAGFSWAKNQIDLAFQYKGVGIVPPTGSGTNFPALRPGEVDIKFTSVPNTTPASATVKLTVEGAGTKAVILLPNLKVDLTKKLIVVYDENVLTATNLQSELFKYFGTQFGPEATNPPVQLKISKTEITLTPNTVLGRTITINDGPTIAWVKAPTERLGTP